jgi:predicted ATP-dependent endonuclease of OLD family
MSDGKKAFVVLKLLLDFSDKKCPILVDQPEDDLDNRAIYRDLVQYLKKKKVERQIIVATHNPNIVVGADSELVIVANQHGVKSENHGSKKFAYKSGSLENSKPFDPTNPIVLDAQGIREHVCVILEGGDVAFKLREKKYAI